MKKKITLIFLLSFNINFGQSEIYYKKNCVSLEFFGHSSSVISFNFERIINPYDMIKFTAKIGIGQNPSYEIKDTKFYYNSTIPIVITTLLGHKYNFAQFGMGYSATFASNLNDDISIPNVIYPRFESGYSLSLGYRYMRDDLIFQLYPILEWRTITEPKAKLWFGISMGKAF